MGESNGDVVRRLVCFFLWEKRLDVKVSGAQYGDGNYVHTGT